MARPSKAALERAREMSEKSDDEIGRWLEALVDGALSERYSNKLARIARRFEILEQSLVDAGRFDSAAPWKLATHFALRGEYSAAGAILRKSPTMLALLSTREQEIGRAKGRQTAAERKMRKEAEWQRVGLMIRRNEPGGPRSDTDLSKEIERKCARTVGGKAGSIRVALKRLGLDRKSWLAAKPVKRPRSKLGGKKLKTFGSLRR